MKKTLISLFISALLIGCSHSYYRQEVELYQENGNTYIREISPQYKVLEACPVTFDSITNSYTICKTKPIAIQKTATFLVKK